MKISPGAPAVEYRGGTHTGFPNTPRGESPVVRSQRSTICERKAFLGKRAMDLCLGSRAVLVGAVRIIVDASSEC